MLPIGPEQDLNIDRYRNSFWGKPGFRVQNSCAPRISCALFPSLREGHNLSEFSVIVNLYVVCTVRFLFWKTGKWLDKKSRFFAQPQLLHFGGTIKLKKKGVIIIKLVQILIIMLENPLQKHLKPLDFLLVMMRKRHKSDKYED